MGISYGRQGASRKVPRNVRNFQNSRSLSHFKHVYGSVPWERALVAPPRKNKKKKKTVPDFHHGSSMSWGVYPLSRDLTDIGRLTQVVRAQYQPAAILEQPLLVFSVSREMPNVGRFQGQTCSVSCEDFKNPYI
jgi:hypothetical protein